MERCSKCGCKGKLTKHHIFPQCFGRYLTSPYLSDQVQKIDLLCRDCHNKYEMGAEILKWDLKLFFNVTGVSDQRFLYDKELKAVRDHALMFCKKGGSIRYKEISRTFFMELLGLQYQQISKKLIKKFCNVECRYKNKEFFHFGKQIIQHVNHQHFIDFWEHDYYRWLLA